MNWQNSWVSLLLLLPQAEESALVFDSLPQTWYLRRIMARQKSAKVTHFPRLPFEKTEV
jgi:hypothetical protein